MAYTELETQFGGIYTFNLQHPNGVVRFGLSIVNSVYDSEVDFDQVMQDLANLCAGAGWTFYNAKKVVPAYQELTPDVTT